jgi:hypothetical protein
MPTTYQTTNNVGTGTRVNLTEFDSDAAIARGVLVATSSLVAAVRGTSSYHDVVYGTIVSGGSGIALRVLGQRLENFVFIAPGASVYGEACLDGPCVCKCCCGGVTLNAGQSCPPAFGRGPLNRWP